MRELLQQVKASLLSLLGHTIEALPAIIFAIIILCFTRYAANLTRQIVHSVAERTLKKKPSLQILLVQTCFVSTWVVGVLFACVLAFPGLKLGDIIGLLGLSSVAIGFAFQDIFKNFLAGILLLLQEPFRLGDQVIINEFEGTLEEIAIRSTQIRTYDGERIVIPNAIVFTSAVRVRTALPHRRTDLDIGVDYNTSLPDAIEILRDALSEVEGVFSNPAPEVDITSFGDSAIDLTVRYWTAPQVAQVRRTKTKVIIALKKACDRAGINIPYPIRTLYYHDPEKFDDCLPDSRNLSEKQ